MKKNLKKLLTFMVVCSVAVTGVACGNKKDDTKTSAKATVKEKTKEITYDEAKVYEETESYDKGTIKAEGVTLKGQTFKTLKVGKEVGEGEAYLENVTVTDKLTVNGGGHDSVYVNAGCNIKELKVNKDDTHIVVAAGTTIEKLTVTNANHVDIYGTVNTIEVVDSGRTDITWTAGIYICEGSVVNTMDLYVNVPIVINETVDVSAIAINSKAEGVTTDYVVDTNDMGDAPEAEETTTDSGKKSSGNSNSNSNNSDSDSGSSGSSSSSAGASYGDPWTDGPNGGWKGHNSSGLGLATGEHYTEYECYQLAVAEGAITGYYNTDAFYQFCDWCLAKQQEAQRIANEEAGRRHAEENGTTFLGNIEDDPNITLTPVN